MKTTVELPDALASEAKRVARAQGVTLRELMIEGLRSELGRRSAQTPIAEFSFPTFGGDGLQPGVTWSNLVELAYEDDPT